MKSTITDWNTALQSINQTLGISTNSTPHEIEYHSALHVAAQLSPAKIIVLNGPAGAGKSTVGKFLSQLNYKRVPRLTTRPRRSYEKDGIDYYFVSQSEFVNQSSSGKVLAAKVTYGHNRGFLVADLEQAFLGDKSYMEGDSSLQAILEYSATHQINLADVLNIFLLPPEPISWSARIERQLNVGHFSVDESRMRLEEGNHYLRKSAERFRDFPRSLYLVNDDLERIESLVRYFSGEPNTLSLHPLSGNVNIGSKAYAHERGILHPIVVIYIENEAGEILIQLRADTGQWDHSAAGHIDLGETPEKAAKRELQEELGISAELDFVTEVDELRHPLIPQTTRHSAYIYKTRHNGPFKLQESEVSEVKFISLQDLRADMAANPNQYSAGMIASIANAYP